MTHVRRGLGAVVVLGVALVLLGRSSLAGPRRPPDVFEIAAELDRAKKDGSKRPLVASLRFLSEVLELKTVESWGAVTPDVAASAAEQVISHARFAPLKAEALAKAGALLSEYGEAMPPSLRAFTLAQQGKKKEAAAVFEAFVKPLVPSTCPGEHPDSSSVRVQRIDFALRTLETFAPELDRAALKAQRQQAVHCQMSNTAVG